jgi:hypothetical protein
MPMLLTNKYLFVFLRKIANVIFLSLDAI